MVVVGFPVLIGFSQNGTHCVVSREGRILRQIVVCTRGDNGESWAHLVEEGRRARGLAAMVGNLQDSTTENSRAVIAARASTVVCDFGDLRVILSSAWAALSLCQTPVVDRPDNGSIRPRPRSPTAHRDRLSLSCLGSLSCGVGAVLH